MAVPVDQLLHDLRAEGDSLDAIVAPLADDQWRTPTPAPGWTIAHQIAHLAWTDEQAICAATDPDAFRARIAEWLAASDVGSAVTAATAHGADAPPTELRARWGAGRQALAEALAAVPSATKLPWFGPPMGAAMMATARLMETWAHGQDVADALGVSRLTTPRLRHVAHIAVAARDFAFVVNSLDPPAAPIRVELSGPDGARWTWGPEDASQRVSGPAIDFCLLVTQRRHRDDLAVVADGVDADRWLGVAQAFAGPPGQGRQPGQFG